MKKEIEITVRVNVSYEKLKEELKQNNFIKKEEYIVNDSYLINSLINITDMKNYLIYMINVQFLQMIKPSQLFNQLMINIFLQKWSLNLNILTENMKMQKN